MTDRDDDSAAAELGAEQEQMLYEALDRCAGVGADPDALAVLAAGLGLHYLVRGDTLTREMFDDDR